MQIKFGKYAINIIHLVLLVYAFLSLINLGHYSLRYDEADTAIVARNILEQGYPHAIKGEQRLVDYIFTNTKNVEVTNGWLHFYLVAISYLLFGYSEFSARLPFVIFGILALWFTYLLGKKLFNEKVALFAVFLLICSTNFFLYIRQSRYYSLQIFFALATLYFYHNFLEGKKHSEIFLFFSLFFISQSYYLGFISIILAIILHFLITHLNFHENKKKYFTLFVSLGFASLIFFLFVFTQGVLEIPYNQHNLYWGFINVIYYVLQFSLFNYSPLILIFFGLPLFAYKKSSKRYFVALGICILFFISFLSLIINPEINSPLKTIIFVSLFAFLSAISYFYYLKEEKSVFFLLNFYIASFFIISFSLPNNFHNFRYLVHLLPFSALLMAYFITKIPIKNAFLFCIIFLIAFTNIIPIITFSYFILTQNENLNAVQSPMQLSTRKISDFLHLQFSPKTIIDEIIAKDIDAGTSMKNYFANKDIEGKTMFVSGDLKQFDRGLKLHLWEATIVDEDFQVTDQFDCTQPYDFIVVKTNAASVNYAVNEKTHPKQILDKLNICLQNPKPSKYVLADKIRYDSWYDNIVPDPDYHRAIPDKKQELYVFRKV